MRPAKVRRALLGWYDRNRRDLPWRRTNDPYAIWVSEVMLQQTRTATVEPYYERFLQLFPDPDALARATEDEVLSAWSGLGYYRRARMLQAGAQAVVTRHGGRVPDDPRALMKLPGIGRYTAGAIASIAYGKPAPILDGNVRRVLSRLDGLDAGRCDRATEQKRLWAMAARLAQGDRPGDLNQAMMELGALVCTPRHPQCAGCPVRSDCHAYGAGDPTAYPAVESRPPIERVEVVVVWLLRGDRLLLSRQTADGPLRGKWDLPARLLAAGDQARAAIRREMLAHHGLRLSAGPQLFVTNHGIMNRRLRMQVFRCSYRAGRVAQDEHLRWVKLNRLAQTPVSGATRKIVRRVIGSDPAEEAKRPARDQRPRGDGAVETRRVSHDADQDQQGPTPIDR
jgi:A/G-specific adenine glycosylase